MTPAVRSRLRELAVAGLSHQEAAAQIPSLSAGTVRVYFNQVVANLSAAEKAKRDKASAKPTSRSFEDRKILSLDHLRIGSRLAAKRLAEGLSLTEFASQYDLSNRVGLSSMEQGYYEFTLTDLKKISQVLEMSIPALMEPLSP